MKLKKTLYLTIALALLLSVFASCSSTGSSMSGYNVNIAVLNGTTGFGIAPMQQKLSNGSYKDFSAKIDIYADATLISPLLISGSADVAALPTNLASVLFNKTDGGIVVLAVNTLGVLYIAENGSSVKSLDDLKGKTVFVPGQGTNPEYILTALLIKKGIDSLVTFDYSYSSPDELSSALASGKAELALLPEPKLSASMSKNASIEIAVDLNTEWKSAFGSELVQGCLVATKKFTDAHPEETKLLLKYYKESIETVNTDKDAAAEAIMNAGLVKNKELILKSLDRCNIVFMTGKEMRDSLITFWDALFTLMPQSIGGKLPGDTIFMADEK